MRKKILILVDSINVEDSSGSKANVALINNFKAAGYELLVCHYTRKTINLSEIKCHQIKELKYTPLYFLSRAQRVLNRRFSVDLSSYLEKCFRFSFTFFNDVDSIVKSIKRVRFAPDLVVTLSEGGSYRPHYALLKFPKWHSVWMAYVHDPYPFHFYPRPYAWIEPNYKAKETFFKNVSLKARYSGFPSKMLMEWMGGYYPNFLESGVVIPHQNSDYEVSKKSIPLYFDETKFNLLHAGNLLNARNPLGLLKGLTLFFEKFPMCRNDVRLIFVGRATGYDKLLKGFQKDNPELIFEDRTVPFDEVYSMQVHTSVNIILEALSEVSPFLPAKFPHCVAANKQIISLSPLYSEVRRLLGVEYPYAAEIDDVYKISNIIEELYFLWKENPDNLLLNREDLDYYLSDKFLKEVINNLDNYDE